MNTSKEQSVLVQGNVCVHMCPTEKQWKPSNVAWVRLTLAVFPLPSRQRMGSYGISLLAEELD